jgi:ATP-dependent DNA ligase
MTSDIRNFSEFKDFPGKINKETQNYEFPTLGRNHNKKGRYWSIYVRLIKNNNKKKYGTNWNIMEDNQVPIKSEYLINAPSFPEGLMCQIWTESGFRGGKMTRYAPSYSDPKNIGKKNERNILQQGLVIARNKYLKKLNEGFAIPHMVANTTTTADAAAAATADAAAAATADAAAAATADAADEAVNSVNAVSAALDEKQKWKDMIFSERLYFPMLAKHYTKYEKKIKYPVYIQAKLDGLRCVVFLNKTFQDKDPKSIRPKTSRDIIMYSRQKKEYAQNVSNNNIRNALVQVLQKLYDLESNCSIYLDGELYRHNVYLQDIGSIARSQEKSTLLTTPPTTTLQYIIYDAFYPEGKKVKMPFKERLDILQNVVKPLIQNNPYIDVLDTKLISNSKDLENIYTDYISDNYEGAMIRNPDSPYSFSSQKTSKIRSPNLLKKKEVFTEEFEVVGFTRGKEGKEYDAVIFICKIPSENNSNTSQFKVVPTGGNFGSYESRSQMLTECLKNNGKGFVDKYKNRFLTIEFRGLSKDKIPQHAKAIAFRDYL